MREDDNDEVFTLDLISLDTHDKSLEDSEEEQEIDFLDMQYAYVDQKIA